MVVLYESLLVILALVYGAFLLSLSVGFRRIRGITLPPLSPVTNPTISVLVATRNEADAILPCVEAILANDYPSDRFEVLIVDDHSEDRTTSHLATLRSRHPASNVTILSMPSSEGRGKQAAIRHGIEHASGEWILVTDADCTVGPQWIRSMARAFSDDVSFVAGPVKYEVHGSFFSQLQALEFAGLVAVGAGSMGLGRPTICNGANVGYRRSAYLAYAEEKDPASDPAFDELLAQHLGRTQPKAVRFCPLPESIITTRPAPTVRAFLKQRQRWASTGARFEGKSLKALLVAIYLFYLLLLISPAVFFFAGSISGVAGLAFFVKIGAEFPLLWQVCRHFNCLRLLFHHLPGQMLQIPYLVGVAGAGALFPSSWKGRAVQP